MCMDLFLYTLTYVHTSAYRQFIFHFPIVCVCVNFRQFQVKKALPQCLLTFGGSSNSLQCCYSPPLPPFNHDTQLIAVAIFNFAAGTHGSRHRWMWKAGHHLGDKWIGTVLTSKILKKKRPSFTCASYFSWRDLFGLIDRRQGGLWPKFLTKVRKRQETACKKWWKTWLTSMRRSAGEWLPHATTAAVMLHEWVESLRPSRHAF